MKRLTLLLMILLLWQGIHIHAQDRETISQDRKIGIGLFMDQINVSSLFGNGSYYLGSKFYFIYNYSEKHRLETELGLLLLDSDEDNTDGLFFGLNYYWKTLKGRTNIYYGPKIGFSSGKSTSVYESGSSYESKDTRWFIGPKVGAEYYISNHFSIGGELGLLYGNYKSYIRHEYPSQPVNEQESVSNILFFETGLVLRFYF